MEPIQMNIPTAAEAKAAINSGNYEIAKRQAKEIEGKIRTAISVGSSAIQVAKLETAVKMALESKGYNVKYDHGGDQRDPYDPFYLITWH